MKTLSRVWNLILDVVMLVMLLAAHVPPQKSAGRAVREEPATT